MKRNEIGIIRNDRRSGRSDWDSRFTSAAAARARRFHRSFPDYRETPLVRLDSLAARLGVAGLLVKDESKRFGLNAFKALGGSYCVAKCVADRIGTKIEDLDYDRLTSPEIRGRIRDLAFVTATDGNHGRGIAWTADRLGVKATVYLPRVSTAERLANIRALGAAAEITPYNYDDTVRYAERVAQETGAILVQDTAWEGYEELPAAIMQGYLTMMAEAAEQMPEGPTHVFLQAGVGAMAGAVTGFLADYYGAQKPVIVIVEPDKANCLYRTAAAGDGALHSVGGDLDSIMAGLACGEPCTIGWSLLSAHADYFVSIPDRAAAKGMRVLAAPMGEDAPITSGESGAATMGLVCEVLENPEMADLRELLGIGEHSRILCISTEGDTDRESYRRIVWEGEYPSL